MIVHILLFASFSLVGRGHPPTVVLDKAPELSSGLAAEELTNYVFKSTGVALKIQKGCEKRTDPVVRIGTLGTLKGVPAEIRTALDARMEDEAYWVGMSGGDLWFVGKNETGELRGMYRFLEDKLGVRWFKASTKDDPGEYVPRVRSIVLEDFVDCNAPHFMIRRLDQSGAWGCHIPRQAMTFANRIGFQTYPAYGARVPFEKPDSEFGAFFGARIMRKCRDSK